MIVGTQLFPGKTLRRLYEVAAQTAHWQYRNVSFLTEKNVAADSGGDRLLAHPLVGCFAGVVKTERTAGWI